MQVKEKAEVYKQCPNINAPFLVGDNKKTGKRVIKKARCKKWECPYCGKINKSVHSNRVANGIWKLTREGHKFEFVTITCHEKWRGYAKSLQNWRKNSGKLLARYRRREQKRTGVSGEYVYIPECHKDGTVHVHGIFTGDGAIRWWKDNARACGLGYMADASRLQSVLQGVNYVTKYISKEVGISSISKGSRRICYSSGFPRVSAPASLMEWHVLPKTESIESAIIDGLVVKGLVVEFDGIVFETVDDLG